MNFDIDLGKVGITPAGEWRAAADYERLTVVSYDGQSYLSLASNKGVTPGTNSAIWMLIAAKGTGTGSGEGGGTGGGSSDIIGVAYFDDGLLYWTKNGDWLLGPDGQKVRAQGIDGQPGQDATGGTAFKSIVFIRADERPDTPFGGSFASPVPEGWFDGIPIGEKKLWMSTRWFYSDANKTALTSWSAPAQATDTVDIDLEFSSIASPGDPTSNPSYWHNEGDVNDIWMAVRKKSNGSWGEWSVMKIKGEDGRNGTNGRDGRDGADGTSVTIKGSLESSDLLPEEENEIGDGYLIDGDLWVWDGDSWVNVGQIQGPAGQDGADGQSQYIHVAYSDDGGTTLTANNGTTVGKYFGYYVSNTSERSLLATSYTWAKFQGDDGFGYEFIYKLTANATAPDVPESSNVDEYVPEGWNDEALDVSAEFPYLWMCYRKKTAGVWGEYTGSATNEGKAALFGKFGRDGANGADGTDGISPNTSFKSIVFKRSNNDLSENAPTGGSYASPVPEGWSDGVPSGNGKLWMSTRIFSSDGEAPQQDEWTTPEAAADNESMDYEFSSVENPGIPSKVTPDSEETNDNWSNTASDTTLWMAMRRISNGAWAAGSTWMIVKVKGERGEDGTSVTIKGTLGDSSNLPSSGNTSGDGYLIDGHLWVWDGDSWVDVGQIQGPAGENGANGQSSILHIKYANLVNGQFVFTANNGETPGDYIGMYWDYNSQDSSSVNDYAPWRAWKGEDGFGYEYIFKLTATATAPDVPAANSQNDDYIPTGWSDNPGDVSESYPYCWECYRKKTGGVWGSFIGSATNIGKAALFAHYGKDGGVGRGIQSVVEMYAANNSATTPPSAWSIVVPELNGTTKKYLWNYEVITYTDGDTITTIPCVIGMYGTGRGIQSIVEHYLASASSSGVTKSLGGWTTAIQTISHAKPFLWNYETINYTDGTSEDTQPIVIGHYGADGAAGGQGVGISSVTEHYLASALATGITKNTAGWALTPLAISAALPYLWNYETINYTDGTSEDTQPCVIGHFGANGSNGVGILRVVEHYLATPLANVTIETPGWTTSVQTMSVNNPYLWNYETIVFSDNSTQDTEPVIIGVFGVSSQQNDLSFLEDVFGQDTVSGESGAILRNLLAVTNTDDVVVAMLNGSAVGQDAEHGKLLIAAGMNGVATAQGIAAAKFKVYQDGYVELRDVAGVNVSMSGTINAVNGTIGPFTISGYYGALTAEWNYGDDPNYEEDSGSMSLTGKKFVLEVIGNDYKGRFVVGHDSDFCVCRIQAMAEADALVLSSSLAGAALRVKEGAVIIGATGSRDARIQFTNGAFAEMEGGSFFYGLKQDTQVYNAANAVITCAEGIAHHYISWGANSKFKLPYNPGNGVEFIVAPMYHDATLECGHRNNDYDACILLNRGALTEYANINAVNSLTLEKNHTYKCTRFETGSHTFWLISKM